MASHGMLDRRATPLVFTVLQVVAALCQSDAPAIAAPLAGSTPATDWESLDRYYRRKLRNADSSALAEYRRSDDCGLALQAAWQPVREEAPSHLDEERTVKVGTLVSAHRFVGFVEGRLRVTLPKWWVRLLLNAYTDADGFVWAQTEIPIEGKPISKKVPRYFQFDGSKWVASDDKTLSIGDLQSITLRGAEYRLPHEIAEKGVQQAFFDLLTETADAKVQLVAVYEEHSNGFPMYGFDRADKHVLWTADVGFGSPRSGAFGPGIVHNVQLVINGDTVYVYGFDATSAYVEAFAINNGTNLFRFGTSYAREE